MLNNYFSLHFRKRRNFLDQNRFMVNRRKISQSKRNTKSIFFIFLFLILVIAIFTTITKFLTIKKIEIKKEKELLVSSQEIKAFIQDFFAQEKWPKNNLIFFNSLELKKNLKNKFPLQEVKFKRKFPDKIFVKIKEKDISAYLIFYGGEIFYLTSDFSLIKAKSFNLTEMPLIYDKTTLPFKKSKIYINLSLQLLKNFQQQGPNSLNKKLKQIFFLKEIDILPKQGIIQLEAKTDQGWKIYLNPLEDLNQQLDNLILVLNEKLQDRKNLSYIDLRFGNKIYYK